MPSRATEPRPPAAQRPSPDRDLAVILAKALRQLGEAGRPVAASRLAAQAWWALQTSDPAGARRVDGVMHFLAGLPEEPGATGRPGTPTPTTQGAT